jgi:hypothetical protein
MIIIHYGSIISFQTCDRSPLRVSWVGSGAGSGRPKNLRIRVRFRIRIPNTLWIYYFIPVTCRCCVLSWVGSGAGSGRLKNLRIRIPNTLRIYYFIPGTGRRCVLSWDDRRAAPLPMWAGHRRGPWTWAGRPADLATTQGEQLSSVPQSNE